jgi:acylphosphatase
MNRRTVHFSGHVQGVGFRYTAQSIATKHGVRGYVRNLPDGRVEVVMEGSDNEMDQVLKEVQQRMESYIRKVHVEESPAGGEFADFSVRG